MTHMKDIIDFQGNRYFSHRVSQYVEIFSDNRIISVTGENV